MIRRSTLALVLPVLFLALAVVPADAQTTAPDDAISARVQQATGLYITGPYVEIRGADGVADLLQRSRMDTAVIDVKDMMGRVHIDSAIPELAEQETGMLGDARALIARLHERGVHCVARIVVFNDGVLARRYPDRAILDSRRHRHGQVWTSWGTGTPWLNPWDTRNHDMVVQLSREAAELGFDEIQLDYIRFPVDDGVRYAQYPHEDPNVRRRDLLLGLLARIDAAVNIPLGVDVFGIQAYWAGDSSGLGQDLTLWRQHVDVYTPMLYLNAMRDWDRGGRDRARRLVQVGIERMRERLGPRPVIRPFLQAFEQEAEDWGPRFIANQIRGARLGGSDGFLFWHPGSSYDMVTRGMNSAARRLSPFPIPQARTRARSSEALGG
jgi:hypothetical protein